MNILRAISNLMRFDRTNWKALALCFFAAAVFWLFNAFNKDHTTNVKFPVLFEFDNSKFIPVDPLPAALTLNVSGNGWELFRKRLGFKVPDITLPLDRPVETRKIPASALSALVASQVGSLQVNYIVTDTLRFRIEPRIARTIKLVADLKEVSFKREFGRTSPVVILPDSVLLEGPKSMLEKLGDSVLVKVHASRISSSFRESVEITLQDGQLIKRNPPVADIMFDVGAMEEIEAWLKLKTPKMPWATEVNMDSVRCSFLLPQKEHDRFLTEIRSASASIQLVELKKGETRYLRPELNDLPSYVSALYIDSVRMKKY